MKKLKKYFFNLKSLFNKKNLKWLKYLPKTLTKTERYLISALIVVIAISGTIIWYRHFLKTTHTVANYGGTLTYGMVGGSKDLLKYTARLNYAGLTKISETGEVIPDLAESWQIVDDGKTYQFKIRPGISASNLLDQIQDQSEWANLDASAPDEQTLIFNFKQPFSPFLYTSTEAIFPYGPYTITSETTSKVMFEANSDYWQGKPYITNIEVDLYPDYNSLISAVKAGSIMAYIKNDGSDFSATNSTNLSMPLPRDLNLFLNLSHPALQDINIRTSLRDGKPLATPLTLTLATSDIQKNISAAESIKDAWQKNNVNITIKTYDNVTLQKNIIPARNYDILLYSEDYGPDPDPYPFWHSSQINTAGENLSDYSNKETDKLLEDARLTFDVSVQAQKYQMFWTKITAQVVYINVKKENCYFNISNNVEGVTKIYGSSESDIFLNVNSWFLKTKRVRN